MSRIGRLPIAIPSGVSVDVSGDAVVVTGPKGSCSQGLVEFTTAAIADNQIVITRSSESKRARANHGLMRALVNNMVTGVTSGFQKKLRIVGVGWRSEVRGSKLVMQLGYSHPIEFTPPEGVSVSVDKAGVITVDGIDKQAVGQAAAVIRGYRTPDHYKGKGVRYIDEYVRIKAGKSA
jgi:large subunit ribosomal protein L6